MSARTLDLLLAGLVDYAGLFPPAGLGMAAAVANFAEYRRGADAAVLGRFVAPVARLEEFEAAADALLPREGAAWPLAALGGDDVAADVRAIGEFNCRHAAAGAGRAVIDVLEFKASSPQQLASLQVPAWLVAYAELPLATDPAAFVAVLAERGLRAKARTGGVTADAFPPAAQLARFLAACARAGVPFKATAGLHHPIRAEYRLTYAPDSPTGTMYGYLNVFVAGIAARAGADEGTLARILEERDLAAFRFTDTELAWRDVRIPADEVAAARAALATSFGSCSFREPVDDLRAAGLR